MNFFTATKKSALLICMATLLLSSAKAQTEFDAIMMNKYQFCNGLDYMHSSWDTYWEGTLKRTNQNLGTVTTQGVMLMPNYGITNNLNVMASATYVWTKASAGTMHGMNGLQDLSVFVKWRPAVIKFGKNKISAFTIGGVSAPLTDYVVDYLPLSLGMGSKNLIGRAMIDFQRNKINVTASAAYIWRSNVKIDRTSYYTTEMHLTNEVEMPNATQYQLRAGYRGKYLIAEALLTKWTTQGGFDMTRNNMPFPSNRMNATSVGVQAKYTLKRLPGLSFVGGGSTTVAGRNMGQATGFNAGVFYAFYFKK